MEAALTLSSDVGIKSACESLDIPRSGFYRTQARKNAPLMEPIKRPSPPRALSSDERQGVLDVLHSDRFTDKAPQEVYATLLDEGWMFSTEDWFYADTLREIEDTVDAGSFSQLSGWKYNGE